MMMMMYEFGGFAGWMDGWIRGLSRGHAWCVSSVEGARCDSLGVLVGWLVGGVMREGGEGGREGLTAGDDEAEAGG